MEGRKYWFIFIAEKVISKRIYTKREATKTSRLLIEPDNEKIFAKIHLIDDLLSIQKLGDSLDIGTRTRAGYLKKDAKLGTIAIKKALADRLEAFIEESNF